MSKTLDETAILRATIARLEHENAEMVEAISNVLGGMTDMNRARNGRQCGIQADDGEKCYIVHSDLIFDLTNALPEAPVLHQDTPDTEGDK